MYRKKIHRSASDEELNKKDGGPAGLRLKARGLRCRSPLYLLSIQLTRVASPACAFNLKRGSCQVLKQFLSSTFALF